MSEVVLSLRGVSVSYGKIAAVRGVSLDLRQGEVATIVGPNGAGKTSLLSAIMGLLPWRGEIAYFGRRAERPRRVEDLVRAGVGLIHEKRELFAAMPVEDNLRLGGYDRFCAGARDLEAGLDEIFLLFPRLRERRRQLAGTLSGGERAMLAMGRALMGRPKILLLDEPSLGLAPLITIEIMDVVKRLRERGVSVLLVEQNARAALGVADHGYVMEAGEIVMQGPADELAADERLVASYLGLADDGAARHDG